MEAARETGRKVVDGHDAEAALVRRYFRAVLGDQAAGDRLADALPPQPRFGQGVRGAGAARVLCDAMRRWRRVHAQAVGAAPFSPASLVRALPPGRAPSRQAAILCDVFELSIAEAAEALDRSSGEVTMLLAEGRAAASAPLGARVLIVEDDPLVAEHLAQVARDVGARRVTIAKNASEAMASVPPDIAVCDYDLGDGPTGADVVRRLSAEHGTACLFVTAHPERASRGGDGEPAFIVAKPFAEGVVRAALRFAATAPRYDVLAA